MNKLLIHMMNAGDIDHRMLPGISKAHKATMLPKAQFGLFDPVNMGMMASKVMDFFGMNKPKIVTTPASASKRLSIRDPRKIMMTTGKPIRPNSDLVNGDYDADGLDNLINEAKRRKMSYNDMMNLAAMGFQETKWGKVDDNIGHVKNSRDFGPEEDNYSSFINAYNLKMKEADRLKIKDEATRLQVYNGLGTIYPSTESKYHGFNMKKIYGVPVPKGGINMRKNPLYGKQIMDLRENVLKQSPQFMRYIDSAYKAPTPAEFGYGGQPCYECGGMYDQGGIIDDPMGQWAHPGEVTRIPGSDITMQGVNYPVLGIGSNGKQQMMYPGKDYSFGGAEHVDEYPMMQGGGQNNSLLKNIKDNSENYLTGWMNSPMYKEMINNSINASSRPNVEKLKAMFREDQMKKMSWDYSDLDADKSWFDKRLSTTLGQFDPSNNKVLINPTVNANRLYAAGIHEGSHATDRGGAYIPIPDITKMIKYKKENEQEKGFFTNLFDDNDFNDYVGKPTETRARLNSVRYIGKQEKLYDPYKEKVDKNILKKFSNTTQLDQLRKIYNDDQIIDMLNSVSQSKKQPEDFIPQAENGGGLLSKTITCSNCGWSWKAVDGGSDPLTCHKCGGTIKMMNGGFLPKAQFGKDWVQRAANAEFSCAANPRQEQRAARASERDAIETTSGGRKDPDRDVKNARWNAQGSQWKGQGITKEDFNNAFNDSSRMSNSFMNPDNARYFDPANGQVKPEYGSIRNNINPRLKYYAQAPGFPMGQRSTVNNILGLQMSQPGGMEGYRQLVKDEYAGNLSPFIPMKRAGGEASLWDMIKMAEGGEMIRRADGSYSKRGLWDNIRANKGSGKKPTKQMLEQERKIKSMQGGGLWNTDKKQWVDSIHNARIDDLNFVQRLFDQSAGSVQIPGEQGRSTHFMESGDSRAYPTVVQQPNRKLQYLNQYDQDAARNYANRTGQYIQFPNDEQAQWYANSPDITKGYKMGTGVLKNIASGKQPLEKKHGIKVNYKK